MVRFNEWLAHPHMEQLLRELEGRKLVATNAVIQASKDEDVLRAAYQLKGVSEMMSLLYSRHSAAKTEEKNNHEGP